MSTSKKGESAETSKADFVRSLAGVSAKEVAAKAKAAGLSFDERYVYNIRTYDNKKARAAAGTPPRPPTKATPAARKTAAATPPAGASSQNATFRKLVLDLGIENAKSLIAELEAKLAAIIAGD